MSRLTSSAVMAQRSEPHDSLDDFPTQPWATRALCRFLAQHDRVRFRTCWEPTCNRGYMARPLAEYFKHVRATDIHDYGWSGQDAVEDFLFSSQGRADAPAADWIVFNPPFRLADQFITHALDQAKVGVAAFVRLQFLEGVGRYRSLYGKRWPWVVMPFAERVPLVRSRIDPEASTATAYCWIVWLTDPALRTTLQQGGLFGRVPSMAWIGPCRKDLELPGDYPAIEPMPAPCAAPLFGDDLA